MLCDNCQLHFDFSSQDYTSVKAATISSLRNSGADASLLEMLETDLNEYQDARRQFQSHKRVDVCPWLSPDSFSLDLPDDVRKIMEYFELPVWTKHFPRKSFNNLAEKGCEMCSRIIEVIQCLGFEPDIVEVESSLVLEPITLLPSEIKVLVEEDNLEYKWVTFKIIEKGHGGWCNSELPLAISLIKVDSQTNTKHRR